MSDNLNFLSVEVHTVGIDWSLEYRLYMVSSQVFLHFPSFGKVIPSPLHEPSPKYDISAFTCQNAQWVWYVQTHSIIIVWKNIQIQEQEGSPARPTTLRWVENMKIPGNVKIKTS